MLSKFGFINHRLFFDYAKNTLSITNNVLLKYFNINNQYTKYSYIKANLNDSHKRLIYRALTKECFTNVPRELFNYFIFNSLIYAYFTILMEDKKVRDFKQLQRHIGLLIDKSGVQNSFLAQQIGIPAANFSVKKQRASWTVDEIEKILTIIENERLEDYFMLELMRAEKNEKRLPVSELTK